MSKLFTTVSTLVVKVCRSGILIRDMDIPHLLTHAQLIEVEKFKERLRENKKGRTS